MLSRTTVIEILLLFACMNIIFADINVEEKLIEIQTKLKEQDLRINFLENENEKLKNEVGQLHRIIQNSHSNQYSEKFRDLKIPSSNLRSGFTAKSNNRRLLLNTITPPSTQRPVKTIAFYAYMSKSENAPSKDFTLVFDVVKTNLGNGYSKYSGAFTAPVEGTYVFTWTIVSETRGAHYIGIMVNGINFGGTISDTQETGDFDSDSGTIVVHLNSSDNVLLKTVHVSYTAIYSDPSHGRTSFAGWRIN